ncbi:MAG TPA: SRPBCC domain-containing protein [Ignavibacteria bacterium]|nr:SRPBCC domain-containing protein [Ignavibacteria bacterium]HMR41113.1 SRPBCC domain-containing protein [Ignavibacteria bacterium]
MEKTVYTKDIANKKIFVKREFEAPLETVWKAWTDSKILDQWWAPKPWKAKTKSMDFREGGSWIYCMCGPNDEEMWSRTNFQNLVPLKSYEGTDIFCNDDGNENPDLPRMNWKLNFKESGNRTTVEVEVTFNSEEDLNKIVEMGFEKGFASAHNNLDELLKDLK